MTVTEARPGDVRTLVAREPPFALSSRTARMRGPWSRDKRLVPSQWLGAGMAHFIAIASDRASSPTTPASSQRPDPRMRPRCIRVLR